MSERYEFTEEYIKTREEIFTTGFPRSGNTWLNRLMSDLLSSAMQTKPGEEIEYFGPDPHNGDYVIRKTHFYAHQYDGYGYFGNKVKMVGIRRDPRDMAVSIMFYRGVQPDLVGVMKSVFLDVHQPGIPVIGYRAYTEGWLNSDSPAIWVTYEGFHDNPVEQLLHLAGEITGKVPAKKFAENVSYRQRFSRWASRYAHSMRKGVKGDWQHYFKRHHGEFITDAIGDLMQAQGYMDDPDWWKELPK